MADEKPTIHIDSDWKKQAQEEKKRLAEQQAQAPQPAAPTAGPAAAAPSGAGGRPARSIPPASFASLVQSLTTQVFFYLGELGTREGQSGLNLDMAKHLIDTLAVLEEKTANNLTADEKRLLDTTLYETRMRYISIASQFTGP